MTEIISRPCCETHEDRVQLTHHLVERFPEIASVEIVGIVNTTRQAEKTFGLPEPDHLATAEIIVRHQLTQLTGPNRSPARLDPGSRRKPAKS